jgi:general secretion pathway protein D
MNAARSALGSGDIDLAEELARAASAVGVPESQFLPDEDRPSLLAWDIVRARQSPTGAQPAAARLPATDPYATQLGDPAAETPPVLTLPYKTTPAAALDTGDRWATLPEPLTLPADVVAPANSPVPQSRYAQSTRPAAPNSPLRNEAPAVSQATQLLRAGEAALERHDRESALELFEQAHAVRQQLAPADRERLQDRLQMLASEPVDTTVTPRPTAPPPAEPETLEVPPTVVTDALPPAAIESPANVEPDASSMIDVADESVQVVARQLSAEVSKRQSEAQRLQTEDPERAVAILREAQQMVERSKLPESSRRELLSRIDITLGKTQKFIDDHASEIDLDKQNEMVMNEVERRREVKIKVEQKTAELVDEFNKLLDEQRYAEAEIVAKRLIEMSPEDPVAQQTYQTAKFVRREMMNRQLVDSKERSVWDQLDAVEHSAINPVARDGEELRFAKNWPDIVNDRKGSKELVERRSERELEIERRLRTPVLLRYQDTPLTEVVDGLSELTGVNIHVDPRGLEQEGYTVDTKVTVNLNKEISLKSALNLILEPLHLSYVIKDEVLKITSEQLRDGEIYPYTYNVADLVIPIPNFVPNNNIGLQGLINDAHAAMGYGNGFGASGPAVLVNDRNPQKTTAGNDQVLAQQFNAAPAANGLSPSTVPIGAGPGGMGGGANADFDSLIDLIVSTVSTETWAENGGGEAEIRPFPTNLSLVISQTQAVHEEIADLLEQLRRLQDLQVTIEVRFIRLSDRFFERIGIDFDMNIEDRTIGTADLVPGSVFEGGRQSATVGLLQPAGTNIAPNFTTDLDVPFRQGSFSVAVPPPFGGFDPNAAATFGFAILSDIEAFFLIEAAQGDSRTNVLNAPKVTLFNGQQAFVADAVSQPFVIGVIPVVGEFVAAQQPVIVVLNEGTMMTIQAVVSDDRRYVRLTVVPFFTQIGDVQEFTFEGSSSTTNSSSSTDDDDDGKNESEEDNEEEARSGVTVQLPAFQFVSVVTTVSVPDGGTVLLGGIKRLSEGRSEFGVPLLSKVPYINRLFRNVGIGRDTDSLMMMVTPRIIIQEEEEERLGIAVP